MRIRATSMVGRSREITGIREALATPSSAIFVLGEPGIGKSRLVAEAVATAHESGTTVLRGRTGTVGPPVPYRPLAEALLSLARSGAVPTDPALTPYLAVLGRLVPEWHRPGGDAPVSPLVLAEAVIRTTAAAGGGRGSLLVLEDLHDADVETLAVVEYLADNLGQDNLGYQRLSLLATSRLEDGAALDLVTAVADRAAGVVIELGRLSREQSDELVGQCLGQPVPDLPDGLTDRLWSDGSGNPFVTEELLRHLVASGRLQRGDHGWRLHPVGAGGEVPTTVVRRIAQRAERLGDRGADVLAAAAVLGRRFPVSLLQRMTGLDDHALLVHLRAALTAQLVAPDDSEQDWYVFQHGLTADAVLATLAPAQRARLSAAGADAVAALHPGLPGDWCQLAARLRTGAGDHRAAAALHLEAGRRAMQAGAAGSAVALLESAEALLTTAAAGSDGPTPTEHTALRADVLTTLLYALAESGGFERAFELAERLDGIGLPPAERATVALRLAWAAHIAGRSAAAWERVATARDLLDAEPSPALSAELHAVEAALVLGSSGADRDRRAEALARESLRLADGLDRADVEAQAWTLLAQVARERDLAESDRCFARVREIAERRRLPIWGIYARQGAAANAWLADGDSTGIREARTHALAAGAIPLARGMDGIEALHHVLRGEFAEAEALLADGMATVERLQMVGLLGYLQMVAATLAAHRLDRAGMETALTAFSASGGPRTASGPLAIGLAQVFCALLEEDRARALHLIAEVRTAQQQYQNTFFLAGHHGLGVLLEEIEGIAPRGDDHPAPAALMRWNRQFVLLAEAVRAGREGRTAQAGERVAQAVEVARPYPLARHLGLRLVGEAAVRDGWADADAWLRPAEAFFHDMGALAPASACRGLLRRTGAPVRQRRDGAERVPAVLRARGVTVREYDVLVELGKRAGNKAIAARLHISPRTVEKHVASLLLKTECTDRTGLLAHLEPGPAAPA